jgi:DNA-directed RNA polymerase subunit beta
VKSFKWLLTDGIKDVLKEFSPVSDYSGKKFEMDFVDFEIEEPKYDDKYARENKLTYEASLKFKIKLINKTLGSEKEQEVFMADFPLMTRHGTFIINGIERVIVPQLARSFGVIFTSNLIRGRSYFGAKIIPARGAWIEFETDANDFVYVRIDKNRKFYATTFLRVLGATTDKEILDLFKDDEKALAGITKTLARDEVKDVNAAYLDIYKRLRDGDLVTLDNAREFVTSIINEERYDFSAVGRFKFNNRFGLPLDEKSLKSKLITLPDFAIIIKHAIALNHTPHAAPDDIDHMGSRRVRFVGEMLQQKVRTGMTQMKRNIQNRMSTIETDTVLPMNFISPRPLQARIKEFFTTNQLSQFMTQDNLLYEIEHLRTISALGPGGLTRERAGLEVRDVHPSQYGRVCPIQTPEGQNIGLILRFTNYCKVNNYGLIETPYVKVVKGKVTSEIVFLNALEEEGFKIAHAAHELTKDGSFVAKDISVRHNGKPEIVTSDEVNFMDIATNQAFSIATSMIPFLNHDEANRALMASNMQKQAVPLLQAEAPLVSTGTEALVLQNNSRIVRSDISGTISYVDGRKIEVSQMIKIRKYHMNLITSFEQTHLQTTTNDHLSLLDKKLKKEISLLIHLLQIMDKLHLEKTSS